MPAIRSSFSNFKPYDPHNRPMADVVLIGPQGARGSLIKCLVDTGADYSVLPLALGKSVGIVTSGPPKPVTTVGGSPLFHFETGISLEVEGYPIITDLFFDPSPNAAYLPLLGRATLLYAFDLGLNIHEWLYD